MLVLERDMIGSPDCSSVTWSQLPKPRTVPCRAAALRRARGLASGDPRFLVPAEPSKDHVPRPGSTLRDGADPGRERAGPATGLTSVLPGVAVRPAGAVPPGLGRWGVGAVRTAGGGGSGGGRGRPS